MVVEEIIENVEVKKLTESEEKQSDEMEVKNPFNIKSFRDTDNSSDCTNYCENYYEGEKFEVCGEDNNTYKSVCQANCGLKGIKRLGACWEGDEVICRESG